jgi:hypothetical protein
MAEKKTEKQKRECVRDGNTHNSRNFKKRNPANTLRAWREERPNTSNAKGRALVVLEAFSSSL